MAKKEKFYCIFQENDSEPDVYLMHYNEPNDEFFFTTSLSSVCYSSDYERMKSIFQKVDGKFSGFQLKTIEF